MAKRAPSKSSRVVYRSAKSGRFTTKKFADKHPSTTTKERINTDGTGPKNKDSN